MVVSHCRLENADGRALRVNKDGDAPDSRHIKRRHHNFRAELFGFLGGLVHVRDGHVGEPVGWRAGFGTFHQAGDHVLALLEDRVIRALAEGLGFPAEQAGIEFFGRGNVLGHEFVPTELANFVAYA